MEESSALDPEKAGKVEKQVASDAPKSGEHFDRGEAPAALFSVAYH